MTEPFSIDIDFHEVQALIEDLGAAPEMIADAMMAAMEKSLDVTEDAVVSRTPVGATGHARGSINTQIFGKPPAFSGEVGIGVDYGYYVEHGRGPGKMPPISAIKYWVIRKKIATGREADVAAFLIARHIGRHGTEGAHMFEEAFRVVEPVIVDIWERLPDQVAKGLGAT